MEFVYAGENWVPGLLMLCNLVELLHFINAYLDGIWSLCVMGPSTVGFTGRNLEG